MTEQYEKMAKELKNALNQFSENVNKILEEMFSFQGKTEKGWDMKYPYEYGDKHYFIQSSGEVVSDCWENLEADNRYFSQGNIFPTEQAAELEAKRRNLMTRFRAFRDECNGDWELDWHDNYQDKYIIKKDNKTNHLIIEVYYTVNAFNLFGYFKNYKDAKRAIELFGDEIKKLFIDCECD